MMGLIIAIPFLFIAVANILAAAPGGQFHDANEILGLITGLWNTSGNDIYYTTGNVGIGTTNPTAKLEIGGTAGVDGIKFPDGTLQKTASNSSTPQWVFGENKGCCSGGCSPTASITLVCPSGKMLFKCYGVGGGNICNDGACSYNVPPPSVLNEITCGAGASNLKTYNDISFPTSWTYSVRGSFCPDSAGAGIMKVRAGILCI